MTVNTIIELVETDEQAKFKIACELKRTESEEALSIHFRSDELGMWYLPADEIIKIIDEGKIPHVTINY